MSTIDNVKAGMGWISPSTRQFCANCKHGGVDAYATRGTAPWRCALGGFATPRTAVCRKWVRK